MWRECEERAVGKVYDKGRSSLSSLLLSSVSAPVLAKIGTQADTSDFRDSMHAAQTASTQQVKDLMQLLKQATRDGGGSSVVQRLTTQFDREFKKFQSLNNQMDQKQVRVIDAVKQNRKYSQSGAGNGYSGAGGAQVGVQTRAWTHASF
jgi:hypothetical protein